MLDQRLSDDLQRLVDEHDENTPITFGELADRIGDRGFGFSLLLLSLPSALPVPAPGYSTPFGLAIAGLALQMIVGRRTPWLPGFITRYELSGAFARRMLATAIGFLRRVEALIKPRLGALHSRPMQSLLGVLVLIMGALMTLPIPGTNTLPAMTIFLVGLGLIEEDGLVIALGGLASSAAVALYGFVIYLMFSLSMNFEEAFESVKDQVKGLLGR